MGTIDSNSSGPIQLPPVGVNADDSASAVYVKSNQKVGEAGQIKPELLSDTIENTSSPPSVGEGVVDPSNPHAYLSAKYGEVFDKLSPGVRESLPEIDDYLSTQGVNLATQEKVSNGGNSWLRGNAYVAFLVNFLDLARLLMEGKATDAQAELASLDMMMEMGNLQAKQILTAGAKAAEMHRIAGITAAVSATTIAATTLVGLKDMAANRMHAEVDSIQPLPEAGQPPPNLNNTVQDLPPNQPKMVETKKYVEYQGKVYRNEGRPITSLSGKDANGYDYLPRGREPVLVNSVSAQMAGYKAANWQNLKGPDGLISNPNIEARNYQQIPVKEVNGQTVYGQTAAEVKADNAVRKINADTAQMKWQGLQQFSTKIGESAKEFLSAGLELKKAEAESLKEIFATISRMISHGMERASASVDANSQMITQTLQQLDQIRAKLQEAISTSYRAR